MWALARLRVICFIIIAALVLPFIPASAAENVLINSSFEDGAGDWSGGDADSAAAYEGEGGIHVVNPFGDVTDGLCSHVLEYNPTIELTAGTVYKLSMHVMNPLTDNATRAVARTTLSEGADNILFTVRGASYEWGGVSDTFLATQSGTYTLSIVLMGGDEAFGFFVDNITLSETEIDVDDISFRGPTSLYIPDEGSLTYHYSASALTREGATIDVLASAISISSANLPDGVEINSQSRTLTVSSQATSGAQFSLRAAAGKGINVSEAMLRVTLTKNMLSDPSFDNKDTFDAWTSDGEMEIAASRAALDAIKDGESGFYATLSSNAPVFLRAGQMYAFRAVVYTDEDYGAQSYAKNVMTDDRGTLIVDILSISSQKPTTVRAAFTPERDGVYALSINLWMAAAARVYVDEVSLTAEEEAPSFITLHAPGNAARATEEYYLPYSALVRNQAGSVMEGETASVYLSPEGKGVRIDEEARLIYISPIAEEGEYTLMAISDTNSSVKGSLSFCVSADFIGDGGFEERAANEWWTAYAPARFTIESIDNSLRGVVRSESESALMINNSYMRLEKDAAYALRLSVKSDYPVTVTAFLDDAFNSDNDVPLAQFTAQGGEQGFSEVLGVDETVTGRLMLYMESDGALDVSFDDIALFEAVVSAANVRIEGVCEAGQSVEGAYTYINNLIDDYADNASQTRWYISSVPTGGFSAIGLPNSAEIELTDAMVGQYIVFEVVPICGKTGMYSAPVRSAPRLVTLFVDGGGEMPTEESGEILKPTDKPHTVTLKEPRPTTFSDINSHWARRTIEVLCASGVVSGKSKSAFAPDDNVTRAEFSAMLLRAFSLIPTAYKGIFSDVAATDWFAGTVETAVNTGIAKGVSDTRFAPHDYITREQMALMTMRAYTLAGGEEPPEIELSFYDAYAISAWAYDGVASAYKLGIIMGSDVNTFLPKKNATRAEAATMIYRLITRLS